MHGLLDFGHVVKVVTNATLTERIEKLIACSDEQKKNLMIKCSFHYRELEKKGLLDTYFANINKALDAGVSAYPFVVICEDYINDLEIISKKIKENLGIAAHCSPCLEINSSYDVRFNASFNPIPDDELLARLDECFDTRIYRECIKYKSVDVQNTFCYAGCWSVGVDFISGKQTKCHGYPIDSDSFYSNIDKEYQWGEPIAMSCAIESCALQYNFFSEGLIPDYPSDYTYGQLIYQPRLVSEYLMNKLDVRFFEIHQRLSKDEEAHIALQNKNVQIRRLENELRSNPFANPKIKQMICKGKKIAIFGTGRIYEKYKCTIDFPVDCFLDSCAQKNQLFEGKRMLAPIELKEKADEYLVVVAVKDKLSLYELLKKNGFQDHQFV